MCLPGESLAYHFGSTSAAASRPRPNFSGHLRPYLQLGVSEQGDLSAMCGLHSGSAPIAFDERTTLAINMRWQPDAALDAQHDDAFESVRVRVWLRTEWAEESKLPTAEAPRGQHTLYEYRPGDVVLLHEDKKLGHHDYEQLFRVSAKLEGGSYELVPITRPSSARGAAPGAAPSQHRLASAASLSPTFSLDPAVGDGHGRGFGEDDAQCDVWKTLQIFDRNLPPGTRLLVHAVTLHVLRAQLDLTRDEPLRGTLGLARVEVVSGRSTLARAAPLAPPNTRWWCAPRTLHAMLCMKMHCACRSDKQPFLLKEQPGHCARSKLV